MTTTSITPPVKKRAYSDAAAIASAKAELETAKQLRHTAEKQAETAREGESIAAGRLAVAIAKAIQRGADPVLVLPEAMLNIQRTTPRIITNVAELTAMRMVHSLSVTGSRFPGWMQITVGVLNHYMPTPLWMEWSKADEARCERSKQEARA